MISGSSKYARYKGGTYMNKISIRELLEQERTSQELILKEMRENGQVHIHVDDLEYFIRAALQFGIRFTVSSKIGDKISIQAA